MNIKKIIRCGRLFVFDKNYRTKWLCSRGFYKSMSDERYLKKLYKASMGKPLNLDNPITFNEKLQWLKLYDRKPIYTTMVDKYEAKKYVADIIGEEHIIPTLGVWDRFEDIDFDSLPNQFVLKCTHDSGGLVICRDKNRLDRKAARKKINAALKRNYYYSSREWPYKDVKPRIIAEQYMEDRSGPLPDYKAFSLDGFTRAMAIATERFNKGEETKFDFSNMEFRHLPFTNGHPDSKKDIKRPEAFEKMVELANEFSKGNPPLGVDFYEIDGQVYFGELTFSHWSGMMPFEPEKWDTKFGEWIKLPEHMGGGGYLITSNNGYILWVHQQASLPSKGLTDYKFYCFDGKPLFLYISAGLENHATASISFLTMDWTRAPFARTDFKPFEQLPPRPECFDEMVAIASRLSQGHEFLRVDLYQINKTVYFSELTFSPCGGMMPFDPPEWDAILGEKIRISKLNDAK